MLSDPREPVETPTPGPATRYCSAPLPAGSAALLCVTEPLDIVGARRFLEHAWPLRSDCRCLVVDLSGVEFIDSSGVQALLFLSQEVEAAGHELRLVLPPGSCTDRILGVLRLRPAFRTFAAAEDACGSFD